MSECRYNGCKSNSISERKKDTEVNSALLLVSRNVNLKLVVDNGGNIINLSISIEELRRENGELVGIVEVYAPVGQGKNRIYDDYIANKHINNGEERSD